MREDRAVLLDVFRIILCLGVVVYHYTPERPSSGPFMVNAFLVMSGFLVGRLFVRSVPFDVVAFYSNKVRRLLPMLLIASILSVTAWAFVGRVFPSDGLLRNVSLMDLAKYYNIPLWYMVVECGLLLAVPLFYWLFQKGYLMYACMAMACYTGFMYSTVPDNTPFGDGLYFSVWARCWQFLVGIASACVFPRYEILKKVIENRCLTWAMFIVFCILTGVLMIIKQAKTLHYWNYTFTFDFVTTIFYAVLIPELFRYKCEAGKHTAALLSYGAALTYPVYLLHFLVYIIQMHILQDWLGEQEEGLLLVTVSIVGTVVSAALLLAADRWLTRRCFT